MKITKDTLFAEVAEIVVYMTDESKERLKKAAERDFGGFYGLTLAQFNAACKNEFAEILPRFRTADFTVFDYGVILAFADFANGYVDMLAKYVIPQTSQEKQASAACAKVGWLEGLLIFSREYFGLKSFAEAEQATLGDLLIAKRDTYNKGMYQRAIIAQQTKGKKR